MEPKRTKYDTNPLDGKVAERAGKSLEPRPTAGVSGGPTRDVGRAETENRAPAESEAPTRRIDDNMVTSYPSIFVPPQNTHQDQPRASTYKPPRPPDASIYQPPPGAPPSVYQVSPALMHELRREHHVSGLGIQEKWANVLPYIPGHIGAVAALVELLLGTRTETRTRFHSAQGMGPTAQNLILYSFFSLFLLL